MAAPRLPELDWLPPVPAGWAEDLAAYAPGSGDWARIVALAQVRLGALETIRLDRRLAELPSPPPGLATRPVRLAVLGSSTVAHLLPGLRVGGLRRGLWVHTHATGYGQAGQALRTPGSPLHGFAPDAVLFASDARHLLSGADAAMSRAEADAWLEARAADLVAQWRLAREAFGALVIQQTLLPVFTPLFGSNEHRLPGSRAALLARFNARLRDMAEAEGAELLAVDAAAARDGLAAWHDPMLWHRAKQEIHPAAAPVYGDLVGRLLAAAQGRSFKALVLDLDNTLWGGVIGDDGMDGIVLGQGGARGEAFVAFQQYAKELSCRGVILAVCSKNDEATALAPFEQHPEMVLKRDDIACFVANWTDKPTNLRRIAEALNIGLNALVFADDNPFERGAVRRELPMVAVPELPDDPALYAQCLASAGYFEGLRLTGEDRARGAQYRANHARTVLQGQAVDLETYLRELAMELRWRRFDQTGKARIVQLVNKTNQFNLTGRRTDEAEVEALMADPRALALQLRLVDRFGDNGVISVVSGRMDAAGDLYLGTWLMSCRVLGRRVEQATLAVVAEEAARLGAKRLIGEYRPTGRNDMVREHYSALGFAPLDGDADGVMHWALPIAGLVTAPAPMDIIEG